MTYMGASAEGAEMMTFLAPPLVCASAFSVVVNTPVLSTTYSAPALAQLMLTGSRSLKTVILLPLTYTVKKKDREFPVPSRNVTTKLSLGGNNDVITEARVWLVTSRLETGNS